jgi:Leucine-rich repeat (LRR) protein
MTCMRAAIQAIGGTVYYAQPDEAFPRPFLRRSLPRDYIDDVQVIYLEGGQVTDAALAHLNRLTGLQELYLDGSQITDAGLADLQGLIGLRWLWLNRTQITDDGLVHLQALTGLQELWLLRTQVTDAGPAQLRQALPNCQIKTGRGPD